MLPCDEAAAVAGLSLSLDGRDPYQGRHSLKLNIPSTAGAIVAVALKTRPSEALRKTVRFVVRTSPRGGRVGVMCGTAHSAEAESLLVGSSWQTVEFNISCIGSARGEGAAVDGLHLVVKPAPAVAQYDKEGDGTDARNTAMAVWVDVVSVVT